MKKSRFAKSASPATALVALGGGAPLPAHASPPAAANRRNSSAASAALGAALVLLAWMLPSSVAQAQNQPWCSLVSGAMSCVYSSPSACEQDIQAIGGDCIPNPAGAGPRPAPADDVPPPPGMGQSGGWAPYCGVTDGGAMSCVYSDVSDCERIVQPQGGYCTRNPRRRR